MLAKSDLFNNFHMQYTYETLCERTWVAVNRYIGEANNLTKYPNVAREQLGAARGIVIGFFALTFDAPTSRADQADMLDHIARAQNQLREQFRERTPRI
ncbi:MULTISPECIES: hypothetical protein [unclassified Caballeronia]|uniref:hypothetical protein n=1 Tax=unclassified Caballeronia TaxID=2646786 RepID=UPI0028600893|nr:MULTISPECIES: hypothetical protein [unclassified Caballeronia]MDR5777720.1 hypothetical protein [Caballeronia sp. LZ002]MDR5798877.1 hypothetical protein [Caballeronia sp. LZ001]MDR5853158.1 hypothetical protein [Caballeronia sp. LZ003]